MDQGTRMVLEAFFGSGKVRAKPYLATIIKIQHNIATLDNGVAVDISRYKTKKDLKTGDAVVVMSTEGNPIGVPV